MRRCAATKNISIYHQNGHCLSVNQKSGFILLNIIFLCKAVHVIKYFTIHFRNIADIQSNGESQEKTRVAAPQ